LIHIDLQLLIDNSRVIDVNGGRLAQGVSGFQNGAVKACSTDSQLEFVAFENIQYHSIGTEELVFRKVGV
jgi:hypothetical protein